MARQFQGPVRPGRDVGVFRRTGISVPKKRRGGGGGIKGPVRPGTDEEIFRKTGQSVPSGSREAQRIRGEIKAREVAEKKAVEEAKKKIELQKKKQEAEKKAEEQLKKDLKKTQEQEKKDIRRFGTVEPVRDEGRTRKNVFGLTGDIERRQSLLLTQEGRGGGGFRTGAELFGLGLAGAGVGAIGSVINPLQTLKGAVKAVKDPIGTASKIKEITTSSFKINPSGSVGGFLGEAATFKAPSLIRKGVVTGVDVARTRGLKELPSKDIIAPEFFKGQTFPTIKKGQTAGELLEEFQPLLPGETRPAGFTASPVPFKKETTALRGTSEVPGVFQAPKVSPRFLRIGKGEEKVFSFSFKETLRPSIMRITPEEFSLTPFTKRGQRTLSPIKQTQEFFETAPKGKSFLPFIKTEKESVIPFETKLVQTDQRFFIKFEGRRIPIKEFEALPGESIGKTKKALPSARDIQKSLSESRVGSKAAFDPLSSLPVFRSSRPSRPRGRSDSSFGGRSKDIDSFRPTFRGGDSFVSNGRGLDSFRPLQRGGSSFGSFARGDSRVPPPVKQPPFNFKFNFEFFGKKERAIPQRNLFRTPSFAAVTLSGFGIKTQKVSSALEQTGLFERAFERPVKGFSSGPVRVKRKKKK